MSKENIIIKELFSFDEIEQVILAFKDSHFLRAITADDKRKGFIEKHMKFGHIIAEYHSDTPVGFISFYCNDIVNKIGYVSAFALDEKLGFLKGKTLMRLIKSSVDVGLKSDVETVRLEVEKDNTKAIKLYRHFGFKEADLDTDNKNSIYMEINFSDLKS